MEDLTKFTDEEILVEYDSARGDVAFYNKDDSDPKSKEDAKQYFDEIRCEMHRRGLVGKPDEHFCD